MMKRILDTLLISAVALLTFSCQEKIGVNMPMNESIVLDLSSGLAKAADTDVESFVNHLDVFIFDVNGTEPDAEVYYDRYQVNNAASIVLNAKRGSFAAGQKYYVYLLANSNLPKADLEAVKSYNDLIDKKQEDYNLHLTGLTIDGAPRYFLMDAVAFQNGSSPVVLNNGVPSDNTVLDAVLRRAAAKVVINIKASEKVEFKSFSIEDGSEGGLYYLRNMPYDTYLLAEARAEENILTAKVRNTTKSNNAYFDWNPSQDSKNVSLVTYVYPNNWADQSSLERESCVVMNLPMTYTDGETVKDYANCWYKIPMTDEQMFKRNNYYEVNIELNRPGAISESTPVDLKDVYYSVIDWTELDIYVGGDDKPKYLMVNETYMEMRNIAVDATTLEFASSSPVTITVKDIYYYNKFGVKTTVNPTITGTTEADATAGNITVNSPVPTNNAIRYFTLIVTNEDGISREVEVAQYPLEYITNQQAWYSYRSDFYNHDNTPDKPTRYDYKGDAYVSAFWSTSNNTWSYSTSNSSNSSPFFRSKVASLSTDSRYQGKSTLSYYAWGTGNSTFASNLSTYKSASSSDDPGNARMYHVQITASSGEYALGIPRRDPETDYTISDADNAKLVSPSFMIASQLGATSSTTSTSQTYIERAKSHCSQYVETYFDDADGDGVWDQGETLHHLDDWRLPTEAEIAIIVKFQTSSEVMDVVLAGANYFCASPTGYVSTGVDSGSGKYTRCIRDVY